MVGINLRRVIGKIIRNMDIGKRNGTKPLFYSKI